MESLKDPLLKVGEILIVTKNGFALPNSMGYGN